MKINRLAFIGLGVMGFPIAGHLANAGYSVHVYNRTTEKAKKWTEKFEGRYFLSPKEAAWEADVVFLCVGNDEDVRSVTTGEDGVFFGMSENSILVDHTTASAEIAKELFNEAKTRKIGFLDAPVSGGQQGAEKGVLTVMVGGEPEIFSLVERIIKTYARACELMGPAGSGQLTKMVNQICIAGLIEGLAEGLGFAKDAGLDPERVVDVISKGAAQSWQMENRYKTMITGDYDHGFAVDWMRKDLSICLSEARKNGTSLPVTAFVDQFYSEIQSLGGGRWDTSSLLHRLEFCKKNPS